MAKGTSTPPPAARSKSYGFFVGHPRDPKGDHQLWVFGAERTQKNASVKTKNNAQTLPKQVQNNFEKVQKTTFLTPKMVKNDPSNRPK